VRACPPQLGETPLESASDAATRGALPRQPRAAAGGLPRLSCDCAFAGDDDDDDDDDDRDGHNARTARAARSGGLTRLDAKQAEARAEEEARGRAAADVARGGSGGRSERSSGCGPPVRQRSMSPRSRAQRSSSSSSSSSSARESSSGSAAHSRRARAAPPPPPPDPPLRHTLLSRLSRRGAAAEPAAAASASARARSGVERRLSTSPPRYSAVLLALVRSDCKLHEGDEDAAHDAHDAHDARNDSRVEGAREEEERLLPAPRRA
jgi:hypothetical protein